VFLGDVYLVFRVLFIATMTPVSAMLVGNAKGVQVIGRIPPRPPSFGKATQTPPLRAGYGSQVVRLNLGRRVYCCVH
jgi:hypothetical protein